MRTTPIDGPGDAGANPKSPRDAGVVRPRAVAHATGMVGFGAVLRDVRKDARSDEAEPAPENTESRDRGERRRSSGQGRSGGRGSGGTRSGARGALVDGAVRHGVAPLPSGGAASKAEEQRRDRSIGGQAAASMGDTTPPPARTMGAVPTIRTEVREVVRTQELGQARERAVALGLNTQGTEQVLRATPRQALDLMVDEATKLAIEQASKELHIELEPEALGPIIVTLRRDGQALEVRMRAERAEAAAELARDLTELDDRLRRLGYVSVRVSADHDPQLHDHR